ncbi:MAG: ATP-dependent Clp protease adaptor ClpS [Bacteroidetes bacterium]|nr:ATP-dependent Clp protease adaptor ClpS [Bacteroidota bacterium]
MSSQKAAPKKEVLVSERTKQENHLILFNDDVNTFDFVIDSLVEVCEHERQQAEQCSIIVHYKGKCEVKKGEFTKLKPMQEALSERGLTASIE